MNPMRDVVRQLMLNKDDDIQIDNAYSKGEKKESDQSLQHTRNTKLHQFERSNAWHLFSLEANRFSKLLFNNDFKREVAALVSSEF